MRDLPFDGAATPLAVAAAWMLERYIDGELTVTQASDPARVYPVDNVDQRRRAFDGFRRPIAEVRGYEEIDDFVARIKVTDAKGRPMIVLVLQHPEHSGKVWQAAMILDPPGVRARSAGPGDAAALRALEAATPIQHAGFEVVYDRPDPFAQDRLRPLPTLRCVAEIGGEVVGTLADALHVLVVDDVSLPVSYVHHSRVRPDHQGEGVMPALNGFNWAPVMRDGVARPGFMYTALGNTKIQSWSSQGNRREDATGWATPIARYTLDCADLAAEEDLERGCERDERHVTDLLAATHSRSVLWPNSHDGWFRERMNRSRRDYSWGNLVVSDRAVVGVWDAGWTITRTGAHKERRRVATILDWGFVTGDPRALESALRAACRSARAEGVTHLLAYSGPPAPGHDVFERLASEVEYFELSTDIPEPADASERGIYVDPVYF